MFSLFSNKRRLNHPVIVALGVLGIAIMQEVVQLIAGQGPVGLDDFFDVLVDMTGTAIGIIVFRRNWRKKDPSKLTNSRIK